MYERNKIKSKARVFVFYRMSSNEQEIIFK